MLPVENKSDERPRESGVREAGDEADPLRSVDSTALMHGARELVIRHGADRYRLRITANDKLILTK